MNLKSTAAVIGLGQTGLSCVRHLVRRGYRVQVYDTRQNPPALAMVRAQFPDVKINCGPLTSSALAEAGLIVVSPGVSIDEPVLRRAVAAGADVAGDVELFARECRQPLIAITGSNGKSTVTELVGQMCMRGGVAACVGGNIGRPVLDLLEQGDDCGAYVLELSSFQLESIVSLTPHAATILNLSEDHLDRHHDLETYLEAKKRVYRQSLTAVVNRDDPRLSDLGRGSEKIVSFGAGLPPTDVDFGLAVDEGETWLVRGKKRLLRTTDLILMGRHNHVNVLAAMALAQTLGVQDEAMVGAATAFAGLAHRMESVATIDNRRFVNDSKATNVGATIAALEGIGGRVVLIAGGEGKGADFVPLRNAVARYAQAVILIGRDASLIAHAIDGAVPIEYARDMVDAVTRARSAAGPGDVVLLAPGCASFDMFDDYQARGEAFRAAVRALA